MYVIFKKEIFLNKKSVLEEKPLHYISTKKKINKNIYQKLKS